MQVGDLIRYWSVKSKPALGLVLRDMGHMELYGEDMVKVYWFDDYSTTDERIRELKDPACEYLEVVNKV
tara:strand:- start:4220 stop:4426 length:207 start_codon:yes stop_codon:yes gene_type:complete